ncbi:MAG: cytosine permease [Bacteroidia bacterium]|nr:cytosine permease [Bacteroidia bacterium]
MNQETAFEADISPELQPTRQADRTWRWWSLAALWVGMSVCIPTYLLGSYMIQGGLLWWESLLIIALANIVIAFPMTLNAHAGTRFGISFPVAARAAFGYRGVHLPALLRALVACGWFGVQTWVGGLAIDSIITTILGLPTESSLTISKFISFGIFWCMNVYFIWKGTESIKWLEIISAPVLLVLGMVLIGWGWQHAGGFSKVLDAGYLFQKQPIAKLTDSTLQLNLLKNESGKNRATQFRVQYQQDNYQQTTLWQPIAENAQITLPAERFQHEIAVQVCGYDTTRQSSWFTIQKTNTISTQTSVWEYLMWLNAMIGFWATMALSISDISRFAYSQKDQFYGQIAGLPTTMTLYSFVGIFVTYAAVLIFQDIFFAQDAPWDPVSLIAKINSPVVIIVAQILILIATLSTNIAANIIAPANAIANFWGRKMPIRKAGLIAAILGILACPWWLISEISSILLIISAALGPALGILLCDYWIIRKTNLQIDALYQKQGQYWYQNGWNIAALKANMIGVFIALIGYWFAPLQVLYQVSWFSGSISAAVIYWWLMQKTIQQPKT